jgi:hypothetical protein
LEAGRRGSAGGGRLQRGRERSSGGDCFVQAEVFFEYRDADFELLAAGLMT